MLIACVRSCVLISALALCLAAAQLRVEEDWRRGACQWMTCSLCSLDLCTSMSQQFQLYSLLGTLINERYRGKKWMFE